MSLKEVKSQSGPNSESFVMIITKGKLNQLQEIMHFEFKSLHVGQCLAFFFYNEENKTEQTIKQNEQKDANIDGN